ncbi:MAG: gamma carbonic anhydrase family protein [Chloroflexota bacterium]|nr:MAG: gamma carbonic anhydrase family protein [Chloroflexota bacterium]
MIIEYTGKRPQIAEDAFIAPTAVIAGDVIIKAGANIWFGAVLRGDENQIVIGERSSIQDNVVIHVSVENPTIVGPDVTIGHAVVLEACRIEAGALVGMNATVLDGAVVGERALIAAGSVVRENQVIPADTLAAGVPAQIKGPMSEAAREHVATATEVYQELAKNYRRALTET